MGMFSLDEQPEYLELERQVKELKEQLRIAKEGRSFFYKDAKAEHMRAVALQHENDMLKQELQELGLRYDTLAALHTNPEDAYRNDFGGDDRIEKAPADFQREYLKGLEKTTYIGLRGIKTY